MQNETHTSEIDISKLPMLEFNHDLFFGSVKKAMTGFASADLWKIPVKELSVLQVMPELNVRLEGEALDRHIRYLADLMLDGGWNMSKPIEVFVADEGKTDAKGNPVPVIYISDGHCRLRALKLALSEGADIKQISCVTLPAKGNDLKDIVAGILVHNSGKDLTPYEKAIVCKRLLNFGMSDKEIAKKVGFTPEYVNLLLEAVSAPLSIVTLIQNGEIALTKAVELIRKHGPKAVGIIKEGLAASKAAGKKGLVGSYLPGAALNKVVKRQAESLYEATKKVSSDPAFAQLSAENQELIKGLLSAIAEKEKKANDKAAQAAQKAAAAADGDAGTDAQAENTNTEAAE
ncbi:ParB/RepB/Spo0J family partition protein [Pseudomonas aeruginosa]|uniref:ParB/RepB/Spo0J family partition protein n=1 Tax=Pseudomonadaceae TaxID=135621 RepID=UPI000B5A49C7|nr:MULTISPECIES: hypothetical protein [Pseudomonas aeruginosa group]ELN4740397.1 hypothetical protein [Escherichia coli]ASJ88656.1 ParB/RepB/Spo0J family partition protein [Pseudomonas aeruginosa]BDC78657.1 hypothetical protein MRCP2_p3920 [Pseudomonas alcaligenes]HBO6962686.1 hypothetical protein [Pseudomonas aeruginosa]HBO7218709.1 hypothetical protein [Pseudomonas aeruginosa]